MVKVTVIGVPGPMALDADTVTGYVPDEVGVPVMAPVVG